MYYMFRVNNQVWKVEIDSKEVFRGSKQKCFEFMKNEGKK
jgi:hypothetical protein